MYHRQEISAQELARQQEFCQKLRARWGAPKKAMVDTYGCQQNESDSEVLRGWLAQCGCQMTQNPAEADVIVINTCAVRAHAEQRVLGNIGALAHAKAENPGLLVCVGGCMAQQEGMKRRLRESFRVVDLVFGPHELWQFPQLLWEAAQRHGSKGLRGRLIAAEPSEGVVAEGLPRLREGRIKAWLSIMNGCDNFCTYCIVPYVRGRERSRLPQEVEAEARDLVAQGFKDITLLGQNVNSYGKGLSPAVDFPALLERLDRIDGEFILRFMTSHPKDATDRLFSAMAASRHCAHHLHLPLQSGSDAVLKAMNRRYTAAMYLEKAAQARERMPDLVLTTDLIVGFPGETEADFQKTLDMVRTLRFDAMFTFLYSPREGTAAAQLPDPVPREEKQRWFSQLLEESNRICAQIHAAYVGQRLTVLVDGQEADGLLTSRTRGGRLVRFPGPCSLLGQFVPVTITGSSTWALSGEVCHG